MAGLSRIGSMNPAATLSLEPATVFRLASVIYGERLSAWQLLGGGLILSLYDLNWKGKQPVEVVAAVSPD